MPGSQRLAGGSSSSRTRTSIFEPFAKALRRAGFEPVVTRTAAGALELAAEAEPDLVMLDLSLPDGDGRDVCRELRRRSDVPIVMLTARGTEMDRIVGLELGADDYVVKPFSAARGDLADPRRPASQRAARRRQARARSRSGSASSSSTRRRASVALGGEELDLSRKEFDLLAELMRNAGRVVTREDLMSRGLGRQLVRLDQDARRPHRLAAAQARRRPRQSSLHRDGARASASADRRAGGSQ